jgi:anti-sigma factor (TIGR02949 family)
VSPAHVLDRLDDYLDGELPPHDMRLVRTHLAGCDDCAAEYRRAAETVETIRRGLRQVAVPAGLHARLATILRELSSSDAH